MGCSNAMGDLADQLLAMFGMTGLEKPASALQPDPARHDVADIAAVDLGEADDQRGLRIDRAADDALDGLDKGARGQDRVVAELRHGGMRAKTLEAQLEIVDGRHLCSSASGDCPLLQARPVVDGIDRLDRETLEQAVFDHTQAAAFVFFGWLEDEVHDAVEGAGLAEQSGRAEQHGGVAVMAAGVHHALVPGRIGQAGPLDNRKRIQLGAKTDGACARAAAQDADNPGAADPLMHLIEAEGAQFLGNETCRFVLVESEFGI
ncbi:hypothetical protein MesoLjLa_31660 [Mesorhizobium sp. L-2-11]|nr:hypothetical protein MesoLjLa_31660 [Mesorhizobium sp. L-2-11]